MSVLRIKWRIYYSDGSTYSDEDGTPADAPGSGVICAACYDEDNRRKLAVSADYYVYEAGMSPGGRWLGVDLFGLWDYLARPGWKTVKFGRMVGDSQFRQVMLAATNDLPLDVGQ